MTICFRCKQKVKKNGNRKRVKGKNSFVHKKCPSLPVFPKVTKNVKETK